MTVGGDEPVGIYLEAGKEHTLTLAVNLERMAPVADDISRLIAEVQDLSMEILKITGNNVEKYRDFELEEYIEDLPGRLTGWADELRELYEELRTFTAGKKKIGEFASLLVCEKQLRSLAKRPNDLPERLNELSQGQNSVGQYLANVLEKLYASPLALDRIFLYQDEADLPDNAGFFRRLFETVRRFFYSFTPGAYDATAGKKSENSLQVWVNRSRQYVEILQEMADGAFTRETGFTVDLSLMPDQGKLVLANAAGNAPDVALGVNYATPFDLAIRGALKNLKEYPGWQEVASRFKSGLLYPGMVEDGLYSLPETTNFLVLFYRTDILGQLGLSVPDTMEEVKQMLPQLRRRGMDFHSHVAGYIGYKPFAATLPFLYQMGGRYYGDTALDIALDSDASLDAITEMIELFTIYDIPYETPNFYQHFRSGLLPIGVGDFGTYTLLLNTAPEIANSWDIALYPGYADETGRVQRVDDGRGGELHHLQRYGNAGGILGISALVDGRRHPEALCRDPTAVLWQGIYVEHGQCGGFFPASLERAAQSRDSRADGLDCGGPPRPRQLYDGTGAEQRLQRHRPQQGKPQGGGRRGDKNHPQGNRAQAGGIRLQEEWGNGQGLPHPRHPFPAAGKLNRKEETPLCKRNGESWRPIYLLPRIICFS